tara:strand:+ start:115 stop:372 length:258 start_codon:yes stop_codon:yes gene_type:complete
MWYEALSTIGWVYVGVVIGGITMLMAISILSGGKNSDYESEIQDLRIQRQMLKEEIFRLSKNKPKPRSKRRPYRKKTANTGSYKK